MSKIVSLKGAEPLPLGEPLENIFVCLRDFGPNGLRIKFVLVVIFWKLKAIASPVLNRGIT